tara:strand:+ start:4371 stop:4694 length:324 start_codon:yes stop_codon:yes gene_type:complete
MLSDNHIKHFIEKSKKFLDRYISYTNNSLGIPSVIKIKKHKKSILDPVTSPYVSFCVTHSVERHYCSLGIATLLETEMCLPAKESFQIAEYIVQKKYNQYIDVVMST